MQHRGTLEFFFDRLRRQSEALTGALHDRAAGSRFPAHEQRDTDDSFVAGHGDLGRCAVLHDIEQ